MPNIIPIAVLVYLLGVAFNLVLFGILINERPDVKNALQNQDYAVLFTILKLSFMSWGVYLRAIFLQVKED